MKVCVFDFDGVIVDSEPIKQAGYRYMFSDHGESVPEEAVNEAIKEFAGGKGDRFDIIRSTLRRTRGAEVPDTEVRAYATKYATSVTGRMRALNVSKSNRVALADLGSRFPLYINSMTPEDELTRTVKELGIDPYFKGIFGTPASKIENLRRIAALEGAKPHELVFIGDGLGDMRAAKEYGCNFLAFVPELAEKSVFSFGIESPDTQSREREFAGFRCVRSIAEIQDYW